MKYLPMARSSPNRRASTIPYTRSPLPREGARRIHRFCARTTCVDRNYAQPDGEWHLTIRMPMITGRVFDGARPGRSIFADRRRDRACELLVALSPLPTPV